MKMINAVELVASRWFTASRTIHQRWWLMI